MYIRLTLFVFVVAFNIKSVAQQSLNVLFLGNSYTGVNNLPQLVSNVALSAGDTVVFSSNTPGGYTLEQHATNVTSMGLIQQGGWDYVILQEQSQLPSFQNYLSTGPAFLSHEVSVFNPCARTMFYMTWGRKNGDANNCASWPPVCTYEGMDSMLRMRYMEMGTVNEAEVSPVGKVWNRIRQLLNCITLTKAIHPKQVHMLQHVHFIRHFLNLIRLRLHSIIHFFRQMRQQ